MKHFLRGLPTGVIVGAAAAAIAYAARAPIGGVIAIGVAVGLLFWLGPLANRRH